VKKKRLSLMHPEVDRVARAISDLDF